MTTSMATLQLTSTHPRTHPPTQPLQTAPSTCDGAEDHVGLGAAGHLRQDVHVVGDLPTLEWKCGKEKKAKDARGGVCDNPAWNRALRNHASATPPGPDCGDERSPCPAGKGHALQASTDGAGPGRAHLHGPQQAGLGVCALLDHGL